MKPLNPRHRLLVHMCPDVPYIIDVGADHGYVAERLGAIASERMPHRRGATPVPWVVADGLKPYKRADAAIIAGMGASKIIDIVSHAPEIPTLILHATDNPAQLRRYLAAHNWRICDEQLAPEANAYAEVLRVTRGQETASGLYLDFGPILTRSNSPMHTKHFMHQRAHWHRVCRWTEAHDRTRFDDAAQRITFLDSILQRNAP